MPAGLLVTVPVPVPLRLTVNVSSKLEDGMKVAVTEALALRVTVQVLVPLHAPLQPVKVEFWLGAAVSVTWVPDWNMALQLLPQLIPDGLLLTVPLPLPAV